MEVKISRIVYYLFLMTVAAGALLLSMSVLAQEETLKLEATHPKLESTATEPIFQFSVSLIYRGAQAQEFDLGMSGPSGWSTYVTSSDKSTRVSVIKLEPNKSDPYQVKVIASPLPSTIVVKDKDYTITLVASSGAISDSIKLTAVVLPTYSLDLLPWSWYAREVTAGKDNFFSIITENTGSGELTNIRFSADKPQEWIVEFQPETIDRLAPGVSQEIQVNIKPTPKAIDRYHSMTLIAAADQTRQTTILSAYVEEPKLPWMWIGGAIALVAVGVFTFIFLKFNRNK